MAEQLSARALVRQLAVAAVLVLSALGWQASSALAAAADNFASAGAISGKELVQGAVGSTKTATKEAGEPNHAGFPGGGSVWYSLTLAQTQIVEMGTCGGFDALLGVYTGTAVNALTEVASNDENPLAATGCGPTDSGVRLTMNAGTKYMIAVDRKTEPGGSFQLQIHRVPLNDDFAAATVMSSALPVSKSVENWIATKEAGEPEHGGQTGGGSAWYAWTAPSTEVVQVTTCTGEGLDTLLGVYTGGAVSELTEVAGNDDAGGLCAKESQVEFEAIEGTTYMIAVDTKAARGFINVRVQ
ncbi:MAG TPA: hypothetical protein VF255_04750 [Solirubrobacterales bacterium]